jgi:hypothetical protein
MNAIPQKVLEDTIIKVSLDFYRPFLEERGRKKLSEVVKTQTGLEAE